MPLRADRQALAHRRRPRLQVPLLRPRGRPTQPGRMAAWAPPAIGTARISYCSLIQLQYYAEIGLQGFSDGAEQGMGTHRALPRRVEHFEAVPSGSEPGLGVGGACGCRQKRSCAQRGRPTLPISLAARLCRRGGRDGAPARSRGAGRSRRGGLRTRGRPRLIFCSDSLPSARCLDWHLRRRLVGAAYATRGPVGVPGSLVVRGGPPGADGLVFAATEELAAVGGPGHAEGAPRVAASAAVQRGRAAEAARGWDPPAAHAAVAARRREERRFVRTGADRPPSAVVDGAL